MRETSKRASGTSTSEGVTRRNGVGKWENRLDARDKQGLSGIYKDFTGVCRELIRRSTRSGSLVGLLLGRFRGGLGESSPVR